MIWITVGPCLIHLFLIYVHRSLCIGSVSSVRFTLVVRRTHGIGRCSLFWGLIAEEKKDLLLLLLLCFDVSLSMFGSKFVPSGFFTFKFSLQIIIEIIIIYRYSAWYEIINCRRYFRFLIPKSKTFSCLNFMFSGTWVLTREHGRGIQSASPCQAVSVNLAWSAKCG